MWWATTMQKISIIPLGFPPGPSLQNILVGILTYPKAPPWSFLAMMWGIRLMELCYKLGDFTVKTELYNEAVSYYKFYLWANLWYQQLRAPPTIEDPFFESRTAQYQDYDEKETVEKETFDITAVDTQILDTGLFCEPVGSFPHFVANKSTVQSAISFDSFELAKQTLKMQDSDMIPLFSPSIREPLGCHLE
jgi:hypothetical protein